MIVHKKIFFSDFYICNIDLWIWYFQLWIIISSAEAQIVKAWNINGLHHQVAKIEYWHKLWEQKNNDTKNNMEPQFCLETQLSFYCELFNHNLRRIDQGAPELWSNIKSNKQTDKIYTLYVYRYIIVFQSVA